ncbi:MAG: twin-arginine translocation signal domain-containing protein [Bacteroidales bacterium]|nr:twin-arginine translocation signal domain-containing protein [Bacteroidales bacterium]
MKRRNFLGLAATGTAGLAMTAGCKLPGNNNTSEGANQAAVSEIPDYRKSLKTSFTSVKGKKVRVTA